MYIFLVIFVLSFSIPLKAQIIPAPHWQTTCTGGTTSFAYTGTAQTYIVPQGCRVLTVKLWGGGGGGGGPVAAGDRGGHGGGGGYSAIRYLGGTFAIAAGGGGGGGGDNAAAATDAGAGGAGDSL